MTHKEKIFIYQESCQIPSLQPVVIEAVSQNDIVPGDLVVYCGHKTHVCHRVLYRKHFDGMLWYFLKSDHKFFPDGWIPAYRIVGKVVQFNKVPANHLSFQLKTFFCLCRSRLQCWAYQCFSNSKPRSRKKRLSFLFPRPLTDAQVA